MSKGPSSKMLAQENNLRRKPGQEQHQGAENQDSQHMQNQPRGSFPDNGSSSFHMSGGGKEHLKAIRVATQELVR